MSPGRAVAVARDPAEPEAREERRQPGGTDPDGGPGRIRPTQPGPLAAFGVLGLVCGWLVRLVCLHEQWTEPQVSWVTTGLLWFLAAALGLAAYRTQQAVRPSRGHPARAPLPPHQAVNRLVLGKASALVGALLAGGFVGYAVAQLGVSTSDLATDRLWHSLLAAAGALGVLIAGLLLERACRVPDDREPPHSL